MAAGIILPTQATENEAQACKVCVSELKPAHAGPGIAACCAGEVAVHTEESMSLTVWLVRAAKQVAATEVTDCLVTADQSGGHVWDKATARRQLKIRWAPIFISKLSSKSVSKEMRVRNHN